MKNKINQAIEFRRKFKLGINTEPTLKTKTKPTLLHALMEEENEEYILATNGLNKKGEKLSKEESIIEVADALGDMLYVLCGTIVEHGMQYKIDEVFNEIQRSNMSKLGEDGEPIYREDGKVLKGSNYFKPNIKDILFPPQENNDRMRAIGQNGNDGLHYEN